VTDQSGFQDSIHVQAYRTTKAITRILMNTSDAQSLLVTLIQAERETFPARAFFKFFGVGKAFRFIYILKEQNAFIVSKCPYVQSSVFRDPLFI
jgi:hypothetical protein